MPDRVDESLDLRRGRRHLGHNVANHPHSRGRLVKPRRRMSGLERVLLDDELGDLLGVKSWLCAGSTVTCVGSWLNIDVGWRLRGTPRIPQACPWGPVTASGSGGWPPAGLISGHNRSQEVMPRGGPSIGAADADREKTQHTGFRFVDGGVG